MKTPLKSIHLLEKFELNSSVIGSKPFELTEIFNGQRRRLLVIKLINSEVLKKHQAIEPITVLCLAGRGVFKAGVDLAEEVNLEAGTLLTLESNVPHEIIAKPALKLLVTKFKQN